MDKVLFLYSNNNYEFAYKIKNICKKKMYEVKNINSFADLFFYLKQMSIPLLFVDGKELKGNREILDMLEKLTPSYFKKLLIFFVDEVEFSNKNIFVIKDKDDVESKVLKILDIIDYSNLNIKSIIPQEKWIKLVGDYLLEKGFYLKHLGSQMIRDAIIYCYENPSAISSFSSTIYSFLSVKYETSLSNVERSIRRAIVFASENGGKITKVTNKEFIMQSVTNVFDDLSF